MQRRRQRARSVIISTVIAMLMTTGCSISGSWKTVSIEPNAREFSIKYVTFDDADRFTATSDDHGQPRTVTGSYQWNGLRLTIVPDRGGEERFYRGRKTGTNSLQLIDDRGDPPIKMTMERVASPSDRK